MLISGLKGLKGGLIRKTDFQTGRLFREGRLTERGA